MRSVWFAIVLAAAGCTGAKPTGPAWPAPSTTADDGGESIEPRDTSVAAAIEKADDSDAEPAATPTAEIVAKPGATAEPADRPVTLSPPTHPTTDDVIITEEIIIEIDD